MLTQFMKSLPFCLFWILNVHTALGQIEKFRLDYWQEGGMRAISQPWFQIRGNNLINITSQPSSGVWKKVIVRDTTKLPENCLNALIEFTTTIRDSSIMRRNNSYPNEITHCLTLTNDRHRIDFRLNNMSDDLAEFIIGIVNPHLPEKSRVKLIINQNQGDIYVKHKRIVVQ